jgi:single-strand DNA-binding protein
MSNFSVRGSLVAKYDTQVISDKFRKREFALEVNDGGQYPQYPKFQLTQAKCELLDGYNVGDDITISFNLRGSRYEKNGTVGYITNLDCWRIERGAGTAGNSVPAQQAAPASNAGAPVDNIPPFVADASPADDLPF